MRACWLKWVGRDWSISADYIWLNYSDANSCSTYILATEEQREFLNKITGSTQHGIWTRNLS